MPHALIETETGHKYRMPITNLIPSKEEYGWKEQFACDLAPGSNIMVDETRRPCTYNEVIETLYKTKPKYRKARDVFYDREIREGGVREIPRLRRELMEWARENHQGLFKEHELLEFDDRLLTLEDEDFSHETLKAIEKEIMGACSEEGIYISTNTAYHWLTRSMQIYPNDPDRAIAIAGVLGIDGLKERTEAIIDDDGTYKTIVGNNIKYLKIYGDPLSRKTRQGKPSRSGDRESRRNECLTGIDKDFEEAVYGKGTFTTMRKVKSVKIIGGMAKKKRNVPTIISLEGDRDEFYTSKGITKPEKSIHQVMGGALIDSIGELERLYMMIAERVANGNGLNCEIDPVYLDVASPFFQYSPDILSEYVRRRDKRILKALTSNDLSGIFAMLDGIPGFEVLASLGQKERKKKKSDLRGTLPQGHMLRKAADRLFETSILSDKMDADTYASRMTPGIRKTERRMLGLIESINKRNMSKKQQKKELREIENRSKHLKKILSDNDVRGKTSKIKRIDKAVPGEVAALRRNTRLNGRRPDKFVGEVTREYGLDAKESLTGPFFEMKNEFIKWAEKGGISV